VYCTGVVVDVCRHGYVWCILKDSFFPSDSTSNVHCMHTSGERASLALIRC